MSKDSANLKSPIGARDLFIPLQLLIMLPFVLYSVTGGLRTASRASVADDKDLTPILPASLELLEDAEIIFGFRLLCISSTRNSERCWRE